MHNQKTAAEGDRSYFGYKNNNKENIYQCSSEALVRYSCVKVIIS